MSETAAMVSGLKRVLKARRINYAQVADALEVSEATVKRMFSKQDFSSAVPDKKSVENALKSVSYKKIKILRSNKSLVY